MRIVWDEPKRQAVLAVRRLDFAVVTVDFFAKAKMQAAKKGRFLALCMIDGRPRFGRHRNHLDCQFTSRQSEEDAFLMRKPIVKASTTDADIAARDASRGYTDADLAEVMDNPEWTEEQLRTAKSFEEVFPDLAASIAREAGAAPMQKVSLLLDADVVARFKAGGRDWQARINEVLKKAAGL